MKWSFLSVGIIVLGIIGVSIIILFQQITTSNESDYYLLKEITESAMIDAIDISYYRDTGDLKIIKEKFVENFTRRFSESTVLTGTGYTINFYDIMELPPKVTIAISNSTKDYKLNGETLDYNIVNKLDAILEYTGKNTNVLPTSPLYNNPYENKTIKKEYYLLGNRSGNSVGVSTTAINMPSEIDRSNIKNVKIKSIKYNGVVTTQQELGKALLRRELDYPKVEANSTNYSLLKDSLITNISNVNISYENCNESAAKLSGSDCNKYDYWIRWTSNTNETKNYSIVKFTVEWSYDEYEYAN